MVHHGIMEIKKDSHLNVIQVIQTDEPYGLIYAWIKYYSVGDLVIFRLVDMRRLDDLGLRV